MSDPRDESNEAGVSTRRLDAILADARDKLEHARLRSTARRRHHLAIERAMATRDAGMHPAISFALGAVLTAALASAWQAVRHDTIHGAPTGDETANLAARELETDDRRHATTMRVNNRPASDAGPHTDHTAVGPALAIDQTVPSPAPTASLSRPRPAAPSLRRSSTESPPQATTPNQHTASEEDAALAALVDRLNRWRATGEYGRAERRLSAALDERNWSTRARDALTFELWDIRSEHATIRACVHWQSFLDQYPESRYADRVQRIRRRLDCAAATQRDSGQ